MQQIKIDEIIMDSSTQSRRMNGPTVYEYAELMQDGVEFPPIEVFHDDRGYWLADGFHRVAAAKEAGFETIRANVQPGGQREAILYSLGPANSAHGLPLTRQERRDRVVKLLNDPEWAQWSDRVIAKHCSVSQPTVSSIRRETNKFINDRKTADGRVMNVENIGQRHWGLNNGMAFWKVVDQYGLDKETILEQLQPGAKVLTDLTGAKDDAFAKLDTLACERLRDLFPFTSVVKHVSGRFGKIQAYNPNGLRVAEFKTGYESLWLPKDTQVSSVEEYEQSQPAPQADGDTQSELNENNNPFSIGDRVMWKDARSGAGAGVIRYIKGEKCGVYLDRSQTTHYYHWNELAMEEKVATIVQEEKETEVSQLEPTSSQQPDEKYGIAYQQYESENVLEIKPSLDLVLGYAEGDIEVRSDLVEHIGALIRWLDGLEQVVLAELEAETA